MNKILTDNVKELVTQLIYNVSGFDQNSEHFKNIIDFSYSHICSPDYYNNYNKRDILRSVENIAEKFKFHAFINQANYLTTLTNKYIDDAKTSEDLNKNLAVLKLLLMISHSPIKYFVEDIQKFQPKGETCKTEIDWGSYLNNCNVHLKQNYAEFSDEDWSDLEESSIIQIQQPIKVEIPKRIRKKAIKQLVTYNLIESACLAKQELFSSIQTEWWNKKDVTVIPSSNLDESKIAFKWDRHVNELGLGLIKQKSNIIPEYRIIRELIWQFFVPHSCFSFYYENDQVVPKSGLSIGSLLPHTLHNFLHEFMPYIEILKKIRSFRESLHGDYFVTSIPDTYRSYCEVIEEIIYPVLETISLMENQICKQEGITTLLTLANGFRPLFQNLTIIYSIHEDIMQNFNVENSFQNTTFLLSRLYFGLLNSSNVREQNIYLTLYLQSLYKYFTIIQIWLEQDTLDDQSDEFIISVKNLGSKNLDYTGNIEYKLKFLDQFSEIDGMLAIIKKKVLKLAKNIHLLRLLGRLYLMSEGVESCRLSLHEEYINNIIQQAVVYSETLDTVSVYQSAKSTLTDSEKYEYLPALGPDQFSEMDSIMTFLDLSDGFLTTVFHSYLCKENSNSNFKDKKILFELINKKILKMFPAKHILEKAFDAVLDARYSIPGILVKNILLTEFKLIRFFSLMKHLYLFDEDIIFPFYKRMFSQFERQEAWGNFFGLTSHLQDLLMDIYPENYETFRVDVDPTWRICNNPIAACDLVSVHVRLDWPISLIFRQEHKQMYIKIFQFFLKIKWGLNTLNRLQFTELESRNISSKLQPKLLQQRIRRIHAMRFVLLNDLSSIQHYILGHLLSVLWTKFLENFEASCDLEHIIKCHDVFIKRIYTFCMKLKHEKSELYGFKKVLNLVLQLQVMWKDVINVDDNVLEKCELDYRKCHKFLRPIIDVEVVTF